MKKQLLMLRSITYAYKAQEYLAGKGISVQIQRTPSTYSACGCGYSIRTKDDPRQIRQMLESVGIEVMGIAEVE